MSGRHGRRRGGRVRRLLFRAAMGVALLGVVGGVTLNLALPFWWQQHGQTVVTIVSGSMSPTIRTGEQVLIQNATPDLVVRPGQIVTFSNGPGGHNLTSHRVVEVLSVDGQSGLWLRTKGDANRTADPTLTSADRVVGVVTTHLHWLGPVMLRAQQAQWRLAAFGPALVLFALAEIPALRGRRDNDAG